MIPGVSEAKESPGTPFPASSQIRERVIVAPPGGWVTERLVDESLRYAASYSILLFDRQHHASRNEDYYRISRLLETRQAVQELGQWRLDFDPRTQHVVIHSLSVRRDGTAVEYAQPDRFRFLQREGGLESQIIDGYITLMVLLEDVRIRDVIDVSYTIHTTPGFLRDRSWLFITVPSQAALRVFHFSVRFASGREMRWKCNDMNLAPSVSELNGETEWQWKMESMLPAEQEPNVPSWHFTGTWVQVTDCASWAEVAAGLASAWGEELDSPKLLCAFEEIKVAALTPAERIDRALIMVQDDIRYLSVIFDVGGSTPSLPGAVLRRKYGDCKDKSFLLTHLLRLLGVKASPVLVNTFLRHTVEQLLPTPAAFDHVIVKFEFEGQTRWVDPTLSLQGGGAIARLLPDYGVGLEVGTDVASLDSIPVLSTGDHCFELCETFSLDSRPGYSSILNVRIKATGWNADTLRRSFANKGEEEMAKSREQFYKQMYPHLERAGPLKWEDDRSRNEFRLSESFDIRNAGTFHGDSRTSIFHFNTHHIRSILGIVQSGKRRSPYLLPFPCNIEHRIEVETTSIMNDSLLPVVENGSTFRFSRDFKRRGNRGIVKYQLTTRTGVISPQLFEKHKTLVNKIWPATSFYFQIPGGHPAPQRRQTSGKLTSPFFADVPGRSSPPVRKRPIGVERGSRKRKEVKSQKEEPGESSRYLTKRRLLIGLFALFVAIWWISALFLGNR